MSTYSEKLRDPRWQKKRLEILERDGWQCKLCLSKEKTLHVHHLLYLKGSQPWDYDSNSLITLCEVCHQKEPEEVKRATSTLIGVVEAYGIRSDEIDELSHIVSSILDRATDKSSRGRYAFFCNLTMAFQLRGVLDKTVAKGAKVWAEIDRRDKLNSSTPAHDT